MTRRAAAYGVGVVLLAIGCTQWQRVGADARPRPETAVPRLFDATQTYRDMGFLVAGPPLPFVAALRHLATPSPDSTLAVLSVSLANQALSFRRSSNEFAAAYQVELTFRMRDSTKPIAQVSRDATVRVRNFQETLRPDESVIFQEFVKLPPGEYMTRVVVRDRNGTNSFARVEQTVTVPRFDGVAVSTPVPIYDGDGRTRLDELPRVLVNPRATAPYGGDSLRFYVEVYRAPRGTRLAARAVDATDAVVWSDTVAVSSAGPLARTVLAVVPSRLPLGRAMLEMQLVGRTDTIRAPLLVSLSDRWVVTNFDQIASLLRYFEAQEWVRRLREATPEQRPQVWRDFWKETDPVPITPENEALAEYFRRLQVANDRYREEGDPGWLTDRGEVFITLGEPDETFDMSEQGPTGGRTVRWTYTTHRLVLYFTDATGFGRYRLTASSRAEYQRVLARVRRTQ